MSDTRHEGPNRAVPDADPFAALADAIGRASPARPDHAPVPHGFGEANRQAGFDHEPAPAAQRPLSDEPYRAASMTAYRTPDGLPPRSPFYSDDEESVLGAALRGLCDPAGPRISGPGETASLAPERYVASHEPAAAQGLTHDDFDELIASELAVLKPQVAEPDIYAGYAEGVSAAPEPAVFHETHAPYHDDVRMAVAPAAASQMPWWPTATGGSRRRRAMFFGGGVAAVALVGVFGLFAGGALFAGGIVGDGEPVLIRADTDPVKMAPTEPGGRVVPNQNKAVYERVARNASIAAPPAQEMLISAAEEPLDISFEDEISNLPGVMVGVADVPTSGAVELAQADAQSTTDAVSSILQPHRVRTFEVRPDGTLVPRIDPPAESATTQDPVEAIGEPTMPFTAPATEAPAAPAAEAPPAAPAAPPAPAEETAVPPAAETAAAPTPAPADAFFVQISSQPSEALARESLQAMSTRYAAAIGGRQLTIQPAEIEGRGTFHRVRVVTASREEANSVCTTLQSAGGSCFVTR